MKGIVFLAKVKEEDFIYLKGMHLSVLEKGKEINRLIKKFSSLLSEYDLDNTETCIRENAKWIIESLGYIRALNLNPDTYNIKQLNNIWQDYRFGLNDKELIDNCPMIDNHYFEEGHTIEKLTHHLIKLNGDVQFELDKADYDDLWKFLANSVKDNKYYISDYVDESGTNEYRLYYFANSLAHNNFRLNKYIVNKNDFYKALYEILLETFYELIEEYNSYVEQIVSSTNTKLGVAIVLNNYII